MLSTSGPSLFVVFTIVLFLCSCVSAHHYYDDQQCCLQADRAKALWTKNDEILLPMVTNYATCGQNYNKTIPPAADAFVKYSFCKTNCSGFKLSRGNEPDAWAGPIVQFILPSLIFSMSIPRQHMFVPMGGLHLFKLPEQRMWHLKLLRAVGAFALALFLCVLVALDTLIWVAAILVLAGPMMVAGLTEALVDYRLLRAMSLYNFTVETKRRIITVIVCGNLWLGDQSLRMPDPLTEIPETLEADPTRQSQRHLDLMSAQGDFGALVGAPVVFYLGGFIYTLLDLLEDPSVQTAAISLAFGVEWMILVHVAIISGCLLASNNPSAVSALVGRPPVIATPRSGWGAVLDQFPPVYQTRYQPVSMWKRGSSKLVWLDRLVTSVEGTQQEDPLVRMQKDVRPGPVAYLFCIILPTVVLISLPPAAGAVVAWKTPPIGWGCRSLSFVAYAACQLLVTVLSISKHLFPIDDCLSTIQRDCQGQPLVLLDRVLHHMFKILLRALYHLFCFLSLFTVLGGTLMQIIGVYSNCFCYVTADMWLRLPEAYVNVASDTWDQRHASQNWITMGAVATCFMSVCAYLGWWYQREIRHRYKRRVEELDRL